MLKRSFPLALLLITGVAFADPPATKAADSAKPETVTVARASILGSVAGDGYFEPIDPFEVRIRPEAYQGDLKIVSIIPHGAVVKEGDVLLEIDATDMKRQLGAAEGEVTVAGANMAKAQADASLGAQSDALALAQARRELANAEFELKWFDEVEGKQFLTRADLNLKAANDNVEDQEDELDQLRKMYKSEELTSATADIVVKRAIRALERSKISAGMIAQTTEKTKTQDFQNTRARLVHQLENQKISLAQLQAQQAQAKIVRDNSTQNAQRAFEKAEQKFADLKKDSDAFTVKSPAAGQVFYGSLNRGGWQGADPKALRTGEKLSPGQVALTLCTPGKLRLVFDLPESQLGSAKAGLKARVTPLGLREAATTGVTLDPPITGSMRDANQLFNLTLELSVVDSRLLPGNRAAVRIDTGKVENALSLPVSAVSRGQVKLVGPDGNATWHDVITGLSDGKMVEIKQGLSEGDTVLKAAE